MFRSVIMVIVLLLGVVSVQAQTKGSDPTRGFSKGTLIRPGVQLVSNVANQQEQPVEPFLLPQDTLLDLQRQVDFQMLPAGFIPADETETESFKLKALRYGIAYYKDSSAPAISGFRDIIVPLRFDTRNGKLEVRYYRSYLIINPEIIRFPEDRPSMAIMPMPDGTVNALLYVLEGDIQELVNIEGLFTDNPRPVNFIGGDDVDGVKANVSAGKFIVFIRGGGARASLFLLITDPGLTDVRDQELLKDLPSSNQAIVFEILPATDPTFRGAPLNPNGTSSNRGK